MRRRQLGSMLLATTALMFAVDPATAFPGRSNGHLGGVDRCPVTRTNDINANGVDTGGFYGGDFANDVLWTNVWMWGEAEVSVLTSHQNAAGEAEGLKWAFVRLQPGDLAIEGRRLDGDAPPLRASIPDGYGMVGFNPVGLTFPAPGCWQVTSRLLEGEREIGRLTFVVRVVYL